MAFNLLQQAWRQGMQPLQIPEGWSQGRATFGGLVAAMLYEKLASKAAQGSLRSLSFSFVGPAVPGKVEMTASILRAGRSVTQVEGRAWQGESVVLAAQASFGEGRASSVVVSPAAAPAFPAPEQCQPMPKVPGVIPEFTQFFDYRIAAGALPFSGASSTQLGGWVRFHEAPEAVTVGHLLALIDAWPPAVLPMLAAPAPASSLTWTLEFIEPLPALSGQHWWQYLAEVEQAGDGYAVTQARLWDAEGRLVALSRQTVTVFG
ncbi:thioesterase family protein [Gallaecimonas xiamenensis]|nr:thioesterase family protein [Gallaecimonas xiamenensis]